MRSSLWRAGRQGAAAVVDQGLLAGASFATTVIVGRTIDEADFGVFAVAFAGLVLSERLQQGLIGAPLMSAAARGEQGSRDVYARAAAVLQLPIMGSLGALTLGTGLFLDRVSSWPHVVEATLGLVGGLIFMQFRDLTRYAFYAGKDAVGAATVSTLGAFLQLAILGVLASTSRLTVGTALLAIALGAFASALLGGALTRDVWLHGGYSSLPWGELLRSGKWLGVSNATLWAAMQAFLFAVAGVLGPAQAGAFRAAQSVLGPTQFVAAGLFNVFTPRAAGAVRAGRGPWPTVGRFSLAALVLVGSYCGLAALFPTAILSALFGGRYLSEGATVQVLSVGYMFTTLAAGMMMGLIALPRTDRVLIAHLVSLVVTVIVAYPLIVRHGVAGAAAGLTVMMLTRFLMLAAMLKVSNTSPVPGSVVSRR